MCVQVGGVVFWFGTFFSSGGKLFIRLYSYKYVWVIIFTGFIKHYIENIASHYLDFQSSDEVNVSPQLEK